MLVQASNFKKLFVPSEAPATANPDVFVADRLIAQWTIPIGMPPSGTMANNGAVTFSTALSRAMLEGCYFWYPADAIFAGSPAAFYWTVQTTTTVGTVYQETYTNTTDSILTAVAPTSPTPWVCTGPGAYTAQTTERYVAQINFPANIMRQYGRLLFREYFTGTITPTSGPSCNYYMDNIVIRSSTNTNIYDKSFWLFYAPERDSKVVTAIGAYDIGATGGGFSRWQFSTPRGAAHVFTMAVTTNAVDKAILLNSFEIRAF